MASDWRKRYQLARPELRRRLEERDANKRSLMQDKAFQRERERLKPLLREAYRRNPNVVKRFLSEVLLDPRFNAQKATAFLSGYAASIRQALLQSLAFAQRFGVRFLSRADGKFQLVPVNSYGSKFHVKAVNGWLEPTRGEPNADWYALSESGDLEVPKELQKQIDEGRAKFVRIDDAAGWSLLNDIEALAGHREGLTFIEHHGTQPYLFCLFGEKATQQREIRSAMKIVTAFNKAWGRQKAGRPANLSQRAKVFDLLRKPGSMKAKAIDLAGSAEEKAIAKAAVALSRGKKSIST